MRCYSYNELAPELHWSGFIKESDEPVHRYVIASLVRKDEVKSHGAIKKHKMAEQVQESQTPYSFSWIDSKAQLTCCSTDIDN